MSAIYALKEGNGPSVTPAVGSANVNFDVPTNPLFKTDLTAAASVVCYEVSRDMTPTGAASETHATSGASTSNKGVSRSSTYSSLNRIYPNSTTVADYLETLTTTPGWKVKLYDDNSDAGEDVSSVDIATDDYFIVLFADDYRKHHFAKITAETSDEGKSTSSVLEFTPAYSGDIPKGTKVAIYKGPAVGDTTVVAVAYGLQGDSSDDRHDVYAYCGRPNFYFYNDRLDNDNQLDHNTKYVVHYSRWDGSTEKHLHSCFVTKQEYSSYIKDYGPYNQEATLVDGLRVIDNAVTGTAYVNYSDTSSTVRDTYTVNIMDWESCFLNKLRTTDNKIKAQTAGSFYGPTRYVHYDESPIKCEVIPRMIECTAFRSITENGSYVDIKIMDPHRIMGNKIKRFDPIKLKQEIGGGSIAHIKQSELFGTVQGVSGSSTLTFEDLNEGQDLRVLLYDGSAKYETIRVGDYHYTISAIAAPAYSGGSLSQLVTIDKYRKFDSATYSSASATLQETISDGTAYRRTWSKITETLIVDFSIDTEVDHSSIPTRSGVAAATSLNYNGTALSAFSDARLYDLEMILLGDNNFAGLRLNLKYGDKINKYVKLQSATQQMYQELGVTTWSGSGLIAPNLLDYFTGNFVVERTIFKGSVEMIKEYIEDYQYIFQITGRNDISKLLGPIVNKDYTFSKDYVYTTLSPPFDVTSTSTTNNAVIKRGDRSFVLSGTGHGLAVGDFVFYYDATENPAGPHFMGRIITVSSATITLEEGCLTYVPAGKTIYYQDHHYISLGKAIQASNEMTNSPTSLTGASDKGLIFESGNKLTFSVSSSEFTSTEGTALAGASANSDLRSRGYYVYQPKGIDGGNDKSWMTLLADESASTITPLENFHTVNSLTDYAVVGIESGEGEALVELAPICPAVLARVHENPKHTVFESFTAHNCQTAAAYSIGHTGAVTVDTALSDGASPMNMAWEGGSFYIKNSDGTYSFVGKVYQIRNEYNSASATNYGYGANYGKWNILFEEALPIALADNTVLYYSNRENHGLYFLNTQGLPQGGLLQVVNPVLSYAKNPIMLTNFIGAGDSDVAGAGVSLYDNIRFFGAPFYRYSDLQKGPIGSLKFVSPDITNASKIKNNVHRGHVSGYAPSYKTSIGSFGTVDDPISFGTDNGPFAKGAGTVSISKGNATVTGSGTNFDGGIFVVNDFCKIGNHIYQIETITNDTTMVLYSLALETFSGVNIYEVSESDGDFRLTQGPPETRGIYPAAGSNFGDMQHYSSAVGDKLMLPSFNRYAKYSFDVNSDGTLGETGATGHGWVNYSTYTTDMPDEVNGSTEDPSHIQGWRNNALSIARTNLEKIDPKMLRWFIFSPSDVYPDSMNRSNHIGFSEKEFKDYTLILKDAGSSIKSSILHQDFEGSLPHVERTDESFEYLPINDASIKTNEMKRFGLMRLRELTFDWHFNPVDPELPPKPTDVVSPTFDYGRWMSLRKTSEMAKNSQGTSMTSGHDVEISSYSGTEITFDTTPTNAGAAGAGGTVSKPNSVNNSGTGGSDLIFVANDLLFADDGSFIGKVSSSDGTTVTLARAPFKPFGSETLYYGPVYTNLWQKANSNPLISTALYKAYGTGEGDSYINTSKEIVNSKGALISGVYPLQLGNTSIIDTSFTTWDVHYDGAIGEYDSVKSNLNMMRERAATATITISGNITEDQTIVIISTDTTSKTYTAKNSPTTASLQFDANGGGPANATSLKAAIEHANGHNGKILVEDNGEGVLTLTQAISGKAGNTTITENCDNTVVVNFDNVGNAQMTWHNIGAPSGINASGTTVTITKSGHGLSVGEIVSINGATASSGTVNGTYMVESVDGNDFTYTVVAVSGEGGHGSTTIRKLMANSFLGLPLSFTNGTGSNSRSWHPLADKGSILRNGANAVAQDSGHVALNISRVLEALSRSDQVYRGCKMVVLDNYSLEYSGVEHTGAGATSDVSNIFFMNTEDSSGEQTRFFLNLENRKYQALNNEAYRYDSPRFASKEIDGANRTKTVNDSNAIGDGVHFVFKPMLHLRGDSGFITTSAWDSSKNSRVQVIDTDSDADYQEENIASAPAGSDNFVEFTITLDNRGEAVNYSGGSTINNITGAGTIATITMDGSHYLDTGDWVTVSGVSDYLYNGTFKIVVTGATTFTYVLPQTVVNGTPDESGVIITKERGSRYSGSIGLNRVCDNSWLKFAPNLTGCYLVSNNGYEYNSTDLVSANTTKYGGGWTPGTVGDTGEGATASIEGATPKHIMYVVSHEVIQEGTAQKHRITCDNYSGAETDLSFFYRVMQPADVCLWENSPETISLYKMSSKYTKQGHNDEMYGDSPHIEYWQNNTVKGDPSKYGYNEAVQSMYVVVNMDTNDCASPQFLVERDYSQIFGPSKTSTTYRFQDGESYNMLLTDGNSQIKRNMGVSTTAISSGYKCDLSFGDKFSNKMVGIVSFGEIFSVKTPIPSTIRNPVSAAIGSAVSICSEAEDIVKDILNTNDITFTETSLSFPYFTGPSFRGIDAYSACNFVADYKDKQLFIGPDGIKLRPETENLDYTNIRLSSDDSSIKLISVSRGESLFDFFNDVTIYGKDVKSRRVDRKSVREIGTKALEELDETIVTQAEADRKAQTLLNLHARPSQRFTLRLSLDGLELIKPGDLITLDYPEERIPTGKYLVLEIRHETYGVVELEVGSYQKGLTERIAELIIQNKKTASFLRANRFKSIAQTNDTFETVGIKEVRFTITHTASTGSPFTIGFNYPVDVATSGGTNTGYPIGFNSSLGSVGTTTILDEDFI
tara:strand:- start:257 stop:8623 length:8367 start_codon:yes stop_codon:yes gene_type:complete